MLNFLVRLIILHFSGELYTTVQEFPDLSHSNIRHKCKVITFFFLIYY